MKIVHYQAVNHRTSPSAATECSGKEGARGQEIHQNDCLWTGRQRCRNCGLYACSTATVHLLNLTAMEALKWRTPLGMQ